MFLRLTKLSNREIEGSDPSWDGPFVEKKISEIKQFKSKTLTQKFLM